MNHEIGGIGHVVVPAGAPDQTFLKQSIAKANESIVSWLRYMRAAMLRFAEISVAAAFLIAGALTLHYLGLVR